MAVRSIDDLGPWLDLWIRSSHLEALRLHLSLPLDHERDGLSRSKSQNSGLPRTFVQLRQGWEMPNLCANRTELPGWAKWSWDARYESYVSWTRSWKHRRSWQDCPDQLDHAQVPINGPLIGARQQNGGLGGQNGEHHPRSWEWLWRARQRCLLRKFKLSQLRLSEL